MQKKLNKKRLLLPILFFLIVIISLSKTKKVVANEQPIPEPYVPCDQKSTPEWNSLRPYQASPCQIPIKEEEQSLLCGNDFVVKQTFTTSVNSSSCQCPSRTISNGTQNITCHCEVPREFETSINAFYSELPIAGNTELIKPGKTSSIGENEKRLTDWKNHLPPDPSKYSRLKDYYQDYQEWRGKTCAETNIPIINFKILFCFNDPLKPDFWSFLFPYIPYSSTEDRIGKIQSSDFYGQPLTDFQITDLKVEWKEKLNDPRNRNTQNREAVLFFPHMEEGVELLTLLQSTFVSKENLNNKQAQQIKNEDIETVSQNSGCKILDSRYNPGDQLFGEQIDSKTSKKTGAPASKVTYTAVFDCPGQYVCQNGNCRLEGECTNTAQFTATINTFTPLAEELWSKSVAGNSSVFRKIMPKITSGYPYEKIRDIPASSKVEYSTSGESANLSVSNPELYFPHLGGIYDYFLHGIQTALRPKDFPGGPSGLVKNQPIPEQDRVNEYLSWYLNGTLFRAEDDPLSHTEETDIKRLTTFSGPLNKLLPQEIQWINKIATNTLNSQRDSVQKTGRVDEIKTRANQDRHDQIVACTKGIRIPAWIPFVGGIEIGGIPTACSEKSIASTGQDFVDKGNLDPTGMCLSSNTSTGSIPPGASGGAGYCSGSFLNNFFDPEDVSAASCICNAESGGNPNAINCSCLTGGTFDYSIGLFQINLLAHCDGGAPFEKNPPMCKITDTSRVIECANIFLDPANNAQRAADFVRSLKSRGYSPWCPWINAAKACGLDVSNCP